MLKLLYRITKRVKSLKESRQAKHPNFNLSLESEERLFYVCFLPARHLFSNFLKKGFGHCFVIEKLTYVYLMYDPTRYGLNTYIPPCTSRHELISEMMQIDKDLTVLEVKILNKMDSLILKPKIMTCVTALQLVLGVDFGFFKGQTPYGFYKQLAKKAHKNIQGVRHVNR